MKIILFFVSWALLITNALCEDINGGVATMDQQDAERVRLKVRLMKALAKSDLVEQSAIERLYWGVPTPWLSDLEPLHDARYEAVKNLIGTKDEDKIIQDIASVCAYLRNTGVSPLFSKVENLYQRANPYAFPEHLRMAGWPMPWDKHQTKGVQGQILATMLAVKGKDFVKEYIRKSATLTPDSNERLLGIWALGYSALPEASDYLKVMSTTGSDREKALAISALNHLVLQMKEDANKGMKIDNDMLANVEKFLTERGIKRAVSAGEYYPF